MTELQLKKAFVEMTGYRGLVVDAEGGDWTDKTGLQTNFRYFANAGMRWLDRRWPGQGNERRYQATLAEGEYILTLPYVQHIRRLDLSDGTNVHRPRQMSYSDFRNMYTEPFADVDEGTPLYWSWYPRPSSSITGLLINGSFTNGLASWTSYTGTPSVTSGVLSLSGNGNGSPNDSIYQVLGGTMSAANEVSVTVDTTESGISLVVILGLWNSNPDDATVVDTETITTTGTHTFTPAGDWDFISLAAVDNGDRTITVSSVSVDDNATESELASQSRQIIFMPRADEDYTVDIWGSFRNVPLSGDSSFNWWTQEHPDLVLEATRAIYERQAHRNVSGAKVFEDNCERELQRLWSEYRYSLYSGMNPEDLAYNG